MTSTSGGQGRHTHHTRTRGAPSRPAPAQPERRPRATRAIVVGAGPAGVLAARVLSDHVDRVVVLERDRLTNAGDHRQSVPPAHHAHDLSARGRAMLDAWFPGLIDLLTERGADVCSLSQPLLLHTVRERLLLQRPNVTILDEVAVTGPIVENGRIVGVGIGGSEMLCDLVLDCSGRDTRLLDLVAAAGHPLPEISSIDIRMTRETMVARHPAGELGTVPDASAPPAPVGTHRTTTAQRRHVEGLERTPVGYLVLGDAICSFDPISGPGMTSAALQARELGVLLSEHTLDSPTLATNYYRRVAALVDVPWRLTVAGAVVDPGTDAARCGADLLDRYLRRVMDACRTSPRVAEQTMQVQHLMAAPASLMTPSMIARVLLASRRSRTRSRPSDVHRSSAGAGRHLGTITPETAMVLAVQHQGFAR